MYTQLCPPTLSTALWLAVLGEERTIPCLAQILHNDVNTVGTCLQQLAQFGIARCCAHRWSTATFHRDLRTHFAELLDAAEESLQARCVLLLTREGGSLSACLLLQSLTENLITSSNTKGASACLNLLIEHLRRWNIHLADDPSLRTFIDLVLMAQSNAFYLGVSMSEAQNLAEQAAAGARLLGDIRTQALVSLIEGCLGSLSGQEREDPVKTLKQGVDAINRMGDSDILEQASHFLSLLHYVQGDFPGTFRHFEAAQHCAPMFKCRYFNEMFPLYMAPSALYMGFFPQAVGLVLAALRDAES